MTDQQTEFQDQSRFLRFQRRALRIAPFAGKVLVVCGSLFVVGYFTFMGMEINRGVAKETELPDHVIRLEIVNASGDSALLNKVADYLDHQRSPLFEIVVVGKREMPRQTHASSFLIARDEPLEAAKLLGNWLKLDESAVMFKPIDINTKDVSITLVLGTDFVKRQKMLAQGSTL